VLIFRGKSVSLLLSNKMNYYSCLQQQMKCHCSPGRFCMVSCVCVLSLWRWTQKVSGFALHSTSSRCFLSLPFFHSFPHSFAVLPASRLPAFLPLTSAVLHAGVWMAESGSDGALVCRGCLRHCYD